MLRIRVCSWNKDNNETRPGDDRVNPHCIGNLHLVLLALNLSILHFDNGATSKIDYVLDEHCGQLNLLPLAVRLIFY